MRLLLLAFSVPFLPSTNAQHLSFGLIHVSEYKEEKSKIQVTNSIPAETLKGEIVSMQTFNYATQPTPHKYILLRMPKGELVGVDLGPAWYLASQGITLFSGEEIQIEGTFQRIEGKPFVIATSLKKGEILYKLPKLHD